jgi:NADPH-dependent 2,4-dienoyl-CoA reductase/sulfur reductase-like enzyme
VTGLLPPVIVGAGPAGLACATALVEAGLRPIVLEEGWRPGGQGTRRLSAAMLPEAARLMGTRAARAAARREAAEDRVLASCDWRPGSLVWGIFGGQLEVVREGRHESVPYERAMIATGATDRIMALPGWTLPGVFSLGAAQVALKYHSAFIGKRIVLAGASPLLYLTAVQYLRMGAPDLTIVDTTPPVAKRRAVFGMAITSPKTLLEGIQLLLELRRHRVRRIDGATLIRAVGSASLEGVDIRHLDGSLETIACDALAFGFGLRPETQLAELAGANFRFDATMRNWFPIVDADGRAGEKLWLAGDSALTGGRVAAVRSGRLAALSIIASQHGEVTATREVRFLRNSLARLRRFQAHMAGAFPWPHEAAADLPDETVVCRCERISAGEIRAAIKKVAGPVEVNRVKSITRCGMGRCQGRYCGQTLQELTAATCELPVAEVGRLRSQAPVRPIPIAASDTDGSLT